MLSLTSEHYKKKFQIKILEKAIVLFSFQNLRTAPQSKDQELVRGNLALSK
jgi:hypothetical protein